jgi:hypothetical protein
MVSECDQHYTDPMGRGYCHGVAYLYKKAVEWYGGKPYSAAQAPFSTHNGMGGHKVISQLGTGAPNEGIVIIFP